MNFSIIGASGNVGRKTIEILEKSKISFKKLYLVASKKSSGKKIKFLGEEICKLYKLNFNLNVEIARFYNVYGPLERIDKINGNVIGIWRSRIKEGLPLQIVGDLSLIHI